MANIKKTFSDNLKTFRQRKGFTQEQLAEKLDVTTRYVQRLEGAKSPNVKIETLAILAKALGINPSDLLKD